MLGKEYGEAHQCPNCPGDFKHKAFSKLCFDKHLLLFSCEKALWLLGVSFIHLCHQQ